jgi:hypothetical protein
MDESAIHCFFFNECPAAASLVTIPEESSINWQQLSKLYIFFRQPSVFLVIFFQISFEEWPKEPQNHCFFMFLSLFLKKFTT